MIDAHVHFLHNRGTYTVEFFEGFVSAAQAAGLDEIYLLEHTHQFEEFEAVYAPVKAYNEYQNNWISGRMNGSIERYVEFIERVRNNSYPVKIHFGLEVCYIPETAALLANILAGYDFDFLTGSVHWIDGWGFDHPKQCDIWLKADVNAAYTRYYEIMCALCESGLFTGLAHPDSIKCFGYYPDYDLGDTYEGLAKLLNKHGMYAENSGGLRLNYPGEQALGMNKRMLDIFQRNKVRMLPASDAHEREDTGKNIRALQEMINKP